MPLFPRIQVRRSAKLIIGAHTVGTPLALYLGYPAFKYFGLDVHPPPIPSPHLPA